MRRSSEGYGPHFTFALTIEPGCAGDMAASQGPPPSDGWANPAVIGLMGFGLTTMVTGWFNTGNLDVGASVVLSLALVFGGAAQLFAGLIAMRKGELFAGSAFIGYGSFWMAVFALLVVVPSFGVAASPHDLLAFWVLWTLFTVSFTINAPKHGLGITMVFVLLIVAFVLLDLHEAMVAYSVSADTIKSYSIAMGWEIWLTGLVAWLVATATLTNTNYGRKIIPL